MCTLYQAVLVCIEHSQAVRLHRAKAASGARMHARMHAHPHNPLLHPNPLPQPHPPFCSLSLLPSPAPPTHSLTLPPCLLPSPSLPFLLPRRSLPLPSHTPHHQRTAYAVDTSRGEDVLHMSKTCNRQGVAEDTYQGECTSPLLSSIDLHLVADEVHIARLYVRCSCLLALKRTFGSAAYTQQVKGSAPKLQSRCASLGLSAVDCRQCCHDTLQTGVL